MIGGDGGLPFKTVDAEERPVIGFAIKVGQWMGRDCISDAVPLYEKPEFMDPDAYCIAKDGYIVGGLIVKDKEGPGGLQIVFMKKTDKGVDVKDSYKSDWYGFTGDAPMIRLAGDGQRVMGTFGRHGMNLDALGLVVAKNGPWGVNAAGAGGDAAGRLSKTVMVGGDGGEPFTKIDPERRPIIGFQFKLGQWAGRDCISGVDAIYEQTAEIDPESITVCLAKPGYVVGGMIVNKKDGADGMQVIFMKMTSKGLDTKDTYKGPRYGYTGAGKQVQLAGDGQLVVGTFGRQGMNTDGFGLVVKAPEAAEKTEAKKSDAK